MRLLFIVFISLAFSGCVHAPATTLSFSSEFKLIFPSTFLAGGTIFSIEELSVKSSEGELVSGGVLSVESEGLPAEFNITEYPIYLLGLKEPGEKYSQFFKDSTAEVDYTYGISSLEVERSSSLTIYSLCKEISCLAYSVKKGFSEHILMLHSRGLSREKLVNLIKGDRNAKY